VSSQGTLVSKSGLEEVLQRVLIRLTGRKGGFPLLPELGSQLYRLLRCAPSQRETLAKQYVREALAEETELSVTDVTLTTLGEEKLGLEVSLRWQGEDGTVALTLG
jgi:phage gp46-like protein